MGKRLWRRGRGLYAVVGALGFLAGACGDASAPAQEADDEALMPGIEGKADTATASTCGPFPSYYMRYLDDTRCTKRLPTNRDRNLHCPVAAAGGPTVTGQDGRTLTYRPATSAVVVDAAALSGIVPSDVRMTVILVRRIGGVPHYRYLSNGTHDQVVQPWSTTKFMAAANAGARLRKASQYRVGLTSTVDRWPVGDLITMVHAYDERHFTSNGLSRYFHDVGGRADAQRLITTWLGRPATETFGGNYGAASATLGFSFVDGSASVTVTPDLSGGRQNQLSTRTLAEFLKRLVMHREDASTRLPGLQWADVQTLLYGAPRSRLYAANTPQGMESDTAVYLQSAVDVARIEQRSQGKWRIFSKLGHGDSRGGEFVHVAYGCFPELDRAGAPVAERGKELFVAAHLGANGKLREGDARLAGIYKDVVSRVLDGRLK